jgi:two-component system nitrogen regulation sensor histidine kinase NtrY
MRRENLAWHVVARALVVAALLSGFVLLLVGTQLYATMIVVLGVAALVLLDTRRIAARVSVDGAEVRMRVERDDLARRLQQSEALLDTVTAALIVVTADGRVQFMNRAARLLAAGAVSRLHELSVLGPSIAELILKLAPGSRQIIQSTEGGRLHVAVLHFRVPERGDARLISLQRVAGELDAVEITAWQDFAGVLTHEIMNSLTPIASLSESLEDLLRAPSRQTGSAEQTEEFAGALEAIKRRSQGLMSFVERYRSLAEISSPRLERIRVEDFLSGIEKLMVASFNERGIVYRRSLACAEDGFQADAQLLEQAVINLLTNAADAALAQADPQVTLCFESNAGGLAISVSDNGAGVRDDAKDRLFVPFFTTKPNGKGIGLSLARQIALAHGGQIEVKPNVPCGTTFSLLLPLVR